MKKGRVESNMRAERSPCINCDFYDLDMGCACSPLDLWYACPLASALSAADFEGEIDHD